MVIMLEEGVHPSTLALATLKFNQMKLQHFILVAVFFLGLSFLDSLIPIRVEMLLLSFIIVYLLHDDKLDLEDE
jgi:hypothetical protein